MKNKVSFFLPLLALAGAFALHQHNSKISSEEFSSLHPPEEHELKIRINDKRRIQQRPSQPIAPREAKPSSEVSPRHPNSISENTSVAPAVPAATYSQQGSGESALPSAKKPLPKPGDKFYDKNDESLLEQNLHRAQTEGSKVAYIGGVKDLFAFDPQFFEQYRMPSGEMDVRLRRTDSVQRVKTAQGAISLSVQRVPYPLPTGQETNYELLKRAIVQAADDGAILINLTTAELERTRLQDPIQYARSRGAVVVTVSKAVARR